MAGSAPESETRTSPTSTRVLFARSGRGVEVPRGTTLLEAARAAGQPLGCACHAEGVCGRCRVTIVGGRGALGRCDGEEARVLARIGAGPDERLGCRAAVLVPGEVVVS